VPAGAFLMGDDAGRADERPAHHVRLGAFAVARLPVTNAQYARFLAATGHAPPRFWHDGRFNAPAQPVVAVSWHDAVAYCDWLRAQTAAAAASPPRPSGRRGARWPSG
jgi:formylglycine-generating enzyme required for sulfatase activity